MACLLPGQPGELVGNHRWSRGQFATQLAGRWGGRGVGGGTAGPTKKTPWGGRVLANGKPDV